MKTIREIEKELKKINPYVGKESYLVIESIHIDLEEGKYITIKGRYGNIDICHKFEIFYKEGESLDYIRGYFAKIVEINEENE